MQWHLDGGPEALTAVLDLGHTPAPEDYGPTLEWERAVWKLFLTLQNQWRVGINGATGLDLTVFIPVIVQKGWHLETALELLTTIEAVILDRKQQDRDSS